MAENKTFFGKVPTLCIESHMRREKTGEKKNRTDHSMGRIAKKRGSERAADSKMSDVGYGNTVII